MPRRASSKERRTSLVKSNHPPEADQQDDDVEMKDIDDIDNRNDHQDGDGDTDEIVREIDVFLSPGAMASQLYLMQFPLQPAQQQSSKNLPDAARIKLHHGMLELDEQIPIDCGNDGNFVLDKRTLTSQTIPISTHMALGKLVTASSSSPSEQQQQQQLHLFPLSHIAQMRPSFAHVDDEHMMTSSAANNGSGSIDAAATYASAAGLAEAHEDKSPTTVTPIMVESKKQPILFQKKETERAAMARKSSYAYLKSSQESEVWQMLVVCGADTVQYKQAKANLTTSLSNKTPLVLAPDHPVGDSLAGRQFVGSGQADNNANSSFVHSLNYIPSSSSSLVHDVDAVDVGVPTTVGATTAPSGMMTSPSSSSSSSLGQICVQLVASLQRGWPVPFTVLRNQFTTTSASSSASAVPQDDEDLLLQALTSCAFLVRGNFVLQSRLLPLTPALQHARTFILFLLQQEGRVERARLQHVFDNDNSTVTPEAIQVLLQQVASKRFQGSGGSASAKGGWVSKLEDNLDFYDLYPEYTQLHNQFWERQAIRFADAFQRYNEGHI